MLICKLNYKKLIYNNNNIKYQCKYLTINMPIPNNMNDILKLLDENDKLEKCKDGT